MSKFNRPVPPPAPPKPPEGKPPIPRGPIKQTEATMQSAKIRCRFCGKAFSDGEQLEKHVSTQHKGSIKKPK